MFFKFERLFRTNDGTALFAVILNTTARHVSIMRWDAKSEQPYLVLRESYPENTGDGDEFQIAKAQAIKHACDVARAVASTPEDNAADVSEYLKEQAIRVKAESQQDARLRGGV